MNSYPMIWPAFCLITINGLFESVRKLEKFMIMDVTTDILEEVAEVTASAARNGVRVDWMDKTLGRIATKRKHLELLDKIQGLEDDLVELDHQWDEISQIWLKLMLNLCIIISVIKESQITL